MSKKKQPPAVKPEDIANVKHAGKRMPIEVSAHQLRPAPWNPRPEISPESVADLAASIRELGLIQRIVVIKDPDKKPVRGVEFYMIVAGHRRFAAWNAANIEGKIPCELLECTIEEAKRMTMIENLQRKDVDPIMEADLIEGLVQGGMTIEAIAAETGRGEKWVWRRKQLVKLTDGWKKLISKGFKFTVDCLERISSYTVEIQSEVYEEFVKYDFSMNILYDWDELRRYFTSRSHELKDAKFPKNECTHCPSNSANAPMLFDLENQRNGKPVKWGKCLCAKCFEEKRLAAIERMKKTASDLGHEIKELKHERDVPRSWDMSDKPDKDHPVLYVYSDYNGKKQCRYGVKPVESKTTEDEKAERKREKEERKLKKETCETINAWIDADAKSAIRDVVIGADGTVLRVDLLMLLMYLLEIGGYEGQRIPIQRYTIGVWTFAISGGWLPAPLSFDEIWDQYFADYVTDVDIYGAARWYQIFRDRIDKIVPVSDEQKKLLEAYFIKMDFGKSVVGAKPEDSSGDGEDGEAGEADPEEPEGDGDEG